MRDRLTEALKVHDVDYADIRIEDKTESQVLFRGPELDNIGSSRTVGGIVRALHKGGWGYATFNDLANLESRVKEACATAKLVGKETSQLATVEPVIDEIKAPMEKDFRDVPLSEKKALLEEYNQIMLKYHEKIQTTAAIYGDTFKTVWFASSEGAYIMEEKPNLFVYVSAIARDGDVIQRGFKSTGGADGYQMVEGFNDKVTEAAAKAVELLSAKPVKGGKYMVVTNPKMTGVFTHEAFGHLSEADFVYENPQMKEIMVLGKRFGVENLNILDDGSIPGGLGTHRYDYEGTPTKKNYLIKDGILVGRLHSRETAAKMGEGPTGNARSVHFQHPPIVRMTNTYLDKGDAKFEDMIKDVELGVYAIDMIGGQTAMEMFTFSAAYGYMIRDGQVSELVRDVTLTGNVFETLNNIDMIGDDLDWTSGGPGGCGKGGQQPLRVGIGGPHIRIQNCVVGGE
ncbi:MAG TPA: TldD/PmbA family protein [Anaerolineales bacterium]